jgi:beta-lactamase superfamily II metal-dependent hydrolase
MSAMATTALYLYGLRRSADPHFRGPQVNVFVLNPDLGGGVVIKTAEEKWAIINPGPRRTSDELARWLRMQRVLGFTVICTHDPSAQAEALQKLSSGFRIKRIVTASGARDLESAGVGVEMVRAGDVVSLSGSVKLKILLNRCIESLCGPDAAIPMTCQLVYRGKRLLVVPPMDKVSEAGVLKGNDDLSSDVLVALYPSSDSISLELLAAVRPCCCVIGSRGRPSRSLLDRLDSKATGADLYRTDIDGTVQVTLGCGPVLARRWVQ